MEKKPKKVLKKSVLIISIIVVLCLIIGGILTLSYSSKLALIGDKKVEVEVFKKYKDKGVKATTFSHSISDKVKITGKVDTKKIGTYKITYYLHYLFSNKKIVRTVEVVDKEKPKITLKGDEEVSIYIGDKYEEAGYEAVDNYDKDLTKKVKVTSKVDTGKMGTYEILYEVEDSSHNKDSKIRKVNVMRKTISEITKNMSNSQTNNKVGTYIKGILIVNKKYHLPATYNPGVDETARSALTTLQQAANRAGFSMPLLSGFRSYTTQQRLYNNYVARDGEAKASTYSAKPGQSEHQTGLAFDVGQLDDNYGETAAGKWLKNNAHTYGFIIRYLKGKENITGYQYEPWHIRYVGAAVASEIHQKGITLEEYLGVS